MNDNHKLVPIAEIIKPHGIKGELKILLYNEESRSLQKNKLVFLGQNNFRKLVIEKVHYSLKKSRIKFFEINNKEDAESLRGKLINIYRSDLPALKKDEFYLNDLINFRIVDKSNNEYGIVKEVLHLPANDVLSVLNNDKEYLVPIIEDVIVRINTDSKDIIINPIKGLF